jgi:hypothetical protein
MHGGLSGDLASERAPIVPQPKCEPTNVGLIRTLWTSYSWPPEWAQPRVKTVPQHKLLLRE